MNITGHTTAGIHHATIALDHVGSDTFSESLKSLAWGGRLVTCGATSGSEVNIDLKLVFFKNLSIFGSTMGGKGDLEKVLRLVTKGDLKTCIDSQFKMEESGRRIFIRCGEGKNFLCLAQVWYLSVSFGI